MKNVTIRIEIVLVKSVQAQVRWSNGIRLNEWYLRPGDVFQPRGGWSNDVKLFSET